MVADSPSLCVSAALRQKLSSAKRTSIFNAEAQRHRDAEFDWLRQSR